MRARRPGSKGTEWLLIKKQDDAAAPGYDIEQYDSSALTGRSIAEIAGDQGSAEWASSRPASRGKVKAPWLADALAKLDKKKTKITTEDTESTEASKTKNDGTHTKRTASPTNGDKKKNSPVSSVSSVVKELKGAIKRPMPSTIHPMLATPSDQPFDDPEWLFEIKWDGYRAVSFIQEGEVRLVSRNQNDLTGQYPELHDLPKLVNARTAILDGEIVALDEEGRSSFSLMQQRTGIRHGGRRTAARSDIPVLYYVFDLLYLDGSDLRHVSLEQRKETLAQIITPGDFIRYSDHFAQGVKLFEAAKQKRLEGILAKKRASHYEERRSHEWLKIKITHTLECMIGGYTDPEGSRQHFGSVVLGLYDKKGRLIHVGQAGSGFDQKTLAAVWQLLKELQTSRSPFHGAVDALRQVHWVKPELVAEIKFSQWTHETTEAGPKLRAPVFLGLREDKDPKECAFEQES
jgi:bifunctional non-homologous end joining protein LigD